jgi:hypothetical protein
MDVYAGEDASLIFQFNVDDELVTPSTATYTLRGNSGSVIAGDQNIASLSTQAVVEIAGSSNTAADGLSFENRFVDVKFVYNNNTYRTRQSYRVVPFVNMTTVPADVRLALGVLDHELADSDIDLYDAYLRVKDRVSVLTTALAAGNLTTVSANKAIAYMAAMNVLPALMLRVAQSTGDDTQTFERLAKIDLQQLSQDVTDAYEVYVSQIDPTFVGVDIPIMTVSTPTDAITGQ